MLLNEGEYGNARLLAPHTVRLMTSNALPPDVGYADIARRMGDIGPTPEMGQGFGLGFAVRTAEGHNPLPGSIGNFYLTGAWGTTFWVDPKERVIAIQMIQTPWIAVDRPGPESWARPKLCLLHHRAITALTDYPGSAMSRSHRRASRSSATREGRFSGGESAAEE